MLELNLPNNAYSILLLLIRIILGFAFLIEAKNKFKNMKKFAKNDGIPLPAAYLTATAELLASLALLTGILPQLAAAGLMILMVCSISLHIFRWHSPYWATRGGWEYDLMLFTLSAVILFYGPGSIALYPWF